ILNGAFFDGVGPPASPPDLTRTGFKAAMVHEIGHFINLDHTVLNHEQAFDGNPGNDVYVPTMFPIAVDDEDALASTNPDDELAALNLYPSGAAANSLSGSVRRGGNQVQGANVVFRKTDDPLMTAYSLISGGLWFPCNPASTCDPCNTACDPGNPAARGSFGADHFAAGQYEICVEQIDTRFSIANASFVGPLATPAILPGPEECFDLLENGTQGDDPDQTDAVTAGSATPVDFDLNPIPSLDPFEPNNTLATGTALGDLPSGRDTVHSVMGVGDLDVFNVPVVAGQRVRVDIDAAELGSPMDAVVGFYNASNGLVALVDDAVDPDSSQFTLDPALELIAGFTGTAKVVVSSYPDTDQNGVGGASSGGYWIRVEVATDTDGDGAPDGEDICPTTARDDVDRDGVCFGADNCPTVANPAQGSVRLNGPLPTNADVMSNFSFSPDGSTVVYTADQDVDNITELYSVPAAGGTPIRLNPALVAGREVFAFRISPDGSRVVYWADQDTNDVTELYSVPIGGGAATRLNGALVTGGVVFGDFRISADSSLVVYRADQDTDEVFELYSVPIAGGSATKLVTPPVAGGDALGGFISPDSSTFVFLADRDVDEVRELYSVSITGGVPTKLSGSLVLNGDVINFDLSPVGGRAVYRADQDTDGVTEVYSVPIGGGAVAKLNGALVAGGSVASTVTQISPDGSRLVYYADQQVDEVFELYSVPIAGGAFVKLNGALVSGGDVNLAFAISPNSSRVIYLADQETDEKLELYSVPIGGGPVVKLNGPLLASGDVVSLGNPATDDFTPDGTRVLYLADQQADEVFELYSVPVVGGAATKLNGALVTGGDVQSYSVSPNGRTVLYVADEHLDSRNELYNVPVTGGGSSKLNDPLVVGGGVFPTKLFSPDSNRVVYHAVQNALNVSEIFTVLVDSEGDGVKDACDLCPLVADPTQADADGNGVGDACQACAIGSDLDADGVCGAADNCPAVANVGQADFDADGAGDACDADDDNDGLLDVVETDTGIFVNAGETGTDPLDADSDGDGVLDGNEVTVGTNPNSAGSQPSGVSFGPPRTITTSARGANAIFAADLDGDGDTDLVSASALDDKIAWYENTGAGSFGPQQVITLLADRASSVVASDLDGDGDLDVLSGSYDDDKIAWYENTDGEGTFGSQQVISTLADGVYSVFAADVDGDGRVDVLSAAGIDYELAWYRNLGSGTFGSQQVVTALAAGIHSVSAADVDGDGDIDALSASQFDSTIAWYENTDGLGTFGPQQVIYAQASNAWSVIAADMDGDGDTDVVSASWGDDKFRWYQNDGSPGGLGDWTVHDISSPGDADGATSVVASDVDADGDLDAVGVMLGKVVWYENLDGVGNFGPQQTVSTIANNSGDAVLSADVDGDGDVDVLSAEADGFLDTNKIAWYENQTIHRSAAFPVEAVVSSSFANWITSIVAADVDGDGDEDVLSASGNDDRIAWYESNGATPPTFTARTVAVDVANFARSVFASDLDG
ncbi:MAG TPA: FG-GAP-like repeat-containing protein, partial [Candidatus Polarisedimenticolaceae bacterium]|nr:FG-GAP-like repeat-containing protein [Candidatus Polarisedimenticolaceae bacterium]